MTFETLSRQLQGYVMSPWEKRAQAISWVAGQYMVDDPDRDEWQLRLDAAKAYDRLHSRILETFPGLRAWVLKAPGGEIAGAR